MRDSARVADKYIGRDGSKPGTYTQSREFTRAAVFAAQRKFAEIAGSAASPISNRQMHEILRAALTASPEIFERATSSK